MRAFVGYSLTISRPLANNAKHITSRASVVFQNPKGMPEARAYKSQFYEMSARGTKQTLRFAAERVRFRGKSGHVPQCLLVTQCVLIKMQRPSGRGTDGLIQGHLQGEMHRRIDLG